MGTQAKGVEYSKRLGPITDEQLRQALARFDLGEYNWTRSHASLLGQTPAMVLGLG